MINPKLVKDFVEIANAKEEDVSNVLLYGTIKQIGEEYYILLDGSDVMTPFEPSIDVADGDRICAKIVENKVYIDNNTSTPATGYVTIYNPETGKYIKTSDIYAVANALIEADRKAGAALSQAGTALTQAGQATTQVGEALTTVSEYQQQVGESLREAGESISSIDEVAGNALKKAGDAETKAASAMSTAGEASTKAGNALSTAGEAVTTAGNALETAGEAVTTADNALETAGDALTTAGEAVTTAEEAVEYAAEHAWSTEIGETWIKTASVIAQNLIVNKGDFKQSFNVNLNRVSDDYPYVQQITCKERSPINIISHDYGKPITDSAGNVIGREYLADGTGELNINGDNIYIGHYYGDTDDLSAHERTLAEIEYDLLGWSVPNSFAVKNYIQDKVFHQRVNRIDMGTVQLLSETLYTGGKNYRYFLSSSKIPNIKSVTNTERSNILLDGYTTYPRNDLSSDLVDGIDKTIYQNNSGYIAINNSSYTSASILKNDLLGHYLYYEMAEEHLISIADYSDHICDKISFRATNMIFKLDGHRAVSLADILSSLNLLIPEN